MSKKKKAKSCCFAEASESRQTAERNIKHFLNIKGGTVDRKEQHLTYFGFRYMLYAYDETLKCEILVFQQDFYESYKKNLSIVQRDKR